MPTSNQTNLRDVTRNQSTLDIAFRHAFLFNNKYDIATFSNATATEFTLQQLTLVKRAANGVDVIPVEGATDLASVIGIVSTEGDVIVPANGTAEITFCHGGIINKDYLILPTGVTFTTVAAGKSLTDILQGIGFSLEGVVENTKFDN